MGAWTGGRVGGWTGGGWVGDSVGRYYRYTGVPRYLGVPVRYRGIYEYKYSTAVCSHHTVFFII